MLEYLIYLIFIISVAMAAGGVVISSKLRNRFRHDIFSTLLYFQVFIFTFGFYGIWGQVAVKAIFAGYISGELLTRFSDMAMLMGLPFLVFAWLMLIQFTREISGRKNHRWFVSIFLLLNFLLLIIVGYLVAKTGNVSHSSVMKYYYISMNFLYSAAASLLLLFPVKRLTVIHNHDRKIIVPVTFLLTLLQMILLIFYTSQLILALVFIFVFFAGNTFLPLYLNYGTLLSAFADENNKDLSFEDFCVKYEVSPRETDIVREICNGLSNREISEKLFISLQTVKDHTHRIYIKTNVKSRVQLIYLVKELKIL
jgi:DNA-binding CsgD family transcriptional regulator